MIEKDYFLYQKFKFDSLIPFGFKKENNDYLFSTFIVDNTFEMIVKISDNGEVDTKVIDTFSQEEYVLHRINKPKGTYALKVKEAYEDVLESIKQQCTIRQVFQSETTEKVIAYIKETYNDELEFLWEDSPTTAIFRRKDSKKWYGTMMKISKNKLGMDNSELVEVINLKILPNEMEYILDGEHYFPGFHMNKKYWYTVILDDSLNVDELKKHIDVSYQLVGKKSKK